MYTKQEIIIKSYREGKSNRQISRDLQISRNTVKKYVEEYDSLERLKTTTDNTIVFSTYLTTAPKFSATLRSKRRLTEEVSTAIDLHLSSNSSKIDEGHRKQVMKKIDIFESLQRQGFDIGYTSVCNYIRQKSNKATIKEAYIRQVYEPGSVCEFDWAEIKMSINGILGRYQLAVFTSAYSNYRYSLIFQRQDTLSFMESHVLFFSHIGGVYHKMTYDNMRVAVSRFVGLHEKEPTMALLQMRGHYKFTHRFCNIYSGNEKGHVERSVEYVRRKAFGSQQSFSTIEQAQDQLNSAVERINQSKQQLTGRSAIDMFNDEHPLLYKAISPLACSDSHQLRVDKYSTICFGTNHYSVPDHLVELLVDAKVYSQKMEFFYRNTLVAVHSRSFGRHQWIIAIDHYLATFTKKPGALSSSVALVNSPYLKKLYQEYYLDTPRDFIDLLKFCIRFNVAQEKLEDTVNRLISLCVHTITTEKITAFLGNKTIENQILEYENSETATHSLKLLTALSAIMN